jgi:hypothetical protein
MDSLSILNIVTKKEANMNDVFVPIKSSKSEIWDLQFA